MKSRQCKNIIAFLLLAHMSAALGENNDGEASSDPPVNRDMYLSKEVHRLTPGRKFVIGNQELFSIGDFVNPTYLSAYKFNDLDKIPINNRTGETSVLILKPKKKYPGFLRYLDVGNNTYSVEDVLKISDLNERKINELEDIHDIDQLLIGIRSNESSAYAEKFVME